jgi:hypothetical protein
MALGIPDGSDAGPWYRTSAPAALRMASGLFVVVTVAHIIANGTGEAVDILYALPVALLAMSFGLRGGLIGAAIGFSLFAVVELVDGVGDIDATGWISRVAGLFLLGALLGRATDQIETGRLRAITAAAERQRLEERARRQAEGLEISDSILQHLAVAKWMIEAGDNERAIEVLTLTMVTGERMVAELLPMRHSGGKAKHMAGGSTIGP